MNLGEKLRKFRKQAGYSQREVAKMMYVSERLIGQYETNHRMPPLDKLESIAKALEIEVTDFFQEKGFDEWLKHFFWEHWDLMKKNMDERRFKMIVQRMHEWGENELVETSDEIKMGDYRFSKSLEKQLLPLKNEHLNFYELWFKRHFENGWVIAGFLYDTPLRIVIKECPVYGYQFNLHAMLLSGKSNNTLQQIVNVVEQWFLSTYKPNAVRYNIEALLSLNTITLDKLNQTYLSLGDMEMNHQEKESINVKEFIEKTPSEMCDRYFPKNRLVQHDVKSLQMKIKKWMEEEQNNYI